MSHNNTTDLLKRLTGAKRKKEPMTLTAHERDYMIRYLKLMQRIFGK